MIKIETVKHEKIWGYEIWLYSPLEGFQTKLEDGTFPKSGPLVKIIKADKPLSVQVHPDDNFAKELESMDNGKSESWYVLDAGNNSELVMGLETYDETQIREALENKTFEDKLKKIKVNKGDFFDIPAGLVHGIGADMTIFEVQQPSDVTYRYYDYNRLQDGKPRELHLDKAIKVQKDLEYILTPVIDEPLTYKNIVGTQIFMNKPVDIIKKCLVVDLDSYDAFIAEKEFINLTNYVIVSL